MTFLRVINNSEKYIEMLKENNKVYILKLDIEPSKDLVESYNPLWGYYQVKSFIVNCKEISATEFFKDYYIMCGDFLYGEGYIKKIINS